MTIFLKKSTFIFFPALGVVTLIAFTVFMTCKIYGITNYYEEIDKEFQLEMAQKIELIQSGDKTFDKEKISNLMRVALMRDLEHGVILLQYKLLLLLLILLFMSTLSLIVVDYKRKKLSKGSDRKPE